MGRLGRYEVLEQMGTGSMGNVYRARDTSLDRDVALKTMRTSIGVDPGVRERFFREARACARLQHPNIITVFDMGEVDNTAYIAMELLEGTDFRRLIHDRAPLTVEAKLAAMAEVCDALAHANQYGVIHRDIKPSNLFLTKEGTAKVLDFGIARLPSSQLTMAGQILGTPNYMAPEQILARPTDGRADLFSAAVVLFEFLAFAHPFQATLIPRRIVQSEPDSLFDYDAALPVILEKVMARGLAKDPKDRYQTGEEFSSDLRAVLDALRGNASVGFSTIVLPSERALPREVPLPLPSVTMKPPEGQDPEEWRLSEALRLLPAFEVAMDRGDISSANAAVSDLEIRLAGDVRFLEAIRLCRSRLTELSKTQVPATQPAPSGSFTLSEKPPQPAPRPAPVSSGSFTLSERPSERPAGPATPPANPAGISGTFDLDSTFTRPSPPTGRDPSPESSTSYLPDPQRPPEPAPEKSSRVIPIPSPSEPPPAPAPPYVRRKQFLIIGIGAAMCITLLLVGAVMLKPRSISVSPSVGTATVAVPVANVQDSPAAAARKIASVAGGVQVNILHLPTAPAQQWLEVQAVSPKVSRPGYVKVAELRDWEGSTGAGTLALLRNFSAGTSGNEEQIQDEIQGLNRLATRFKGEPAANEARLEVLRLRFALATRPESIAKPREEWEPELQGEKSELDPLRNDSNIQPQVAGLSDAIDAFLSQHPATPAVVKTVPPAPAVTHTTPRPPAANATESLNKARQLRQDGDYEAAELLLENFLKTNPTNKDAQELLRKIKLSRDAEKK